MTKANSCEIGVILDRSGSMASLKADVEGGFGRFIADQKKLPGECGVTLTQFDTEGIDLVYEGKPVAQVPALELVPRGGTPLLDAVGRTIVKLGERFKSMPEEGRPARVLVVIITDGEENSSREFKKAQIKEMVERQRSVYKWEFVYLGANVDAFHEAGSMGIPQAMAASYTPDSAGVQASFRALGNVAASYRAGGLADITDEDRHALGKKRR